MKNGAAYVTFWAKSAKPCIKKSGIIFSEGDIGLNIRVSIKQPPALPDSFYCETIAFGIGGSGQSSLPYSDQMAAPQSATYAPLFPTWTKYAIKIPDSSMYVRGNEFGTLYPKSEPFELLGAFYWVKGGDQMATDDTSEFFVDNIQYTSANNLSIDKVPASFIQNEGLNTSFYTYVNTPPVNAYDHAIELPMTKRIDDQEYEIWPSAINPYTCLSSKSVCIPFNKR